MTNSYVSVQIPVARLDHLRAYVRRHNLTTPLPEVERLDWPRRFREYLEDIAEERGMRSEEIARDLGLLPAREDWPENQQIHRYLLSWGWTITPFLRGYECRYVHPEYPERTLGLPSFKDNLSPVTYDTIDTVMGHPKGTAATMLGFKYPKE